LHLFLQIFMYWWGGANCSLCPSCPMGKGRPWHFNLYLTVHHHGCGLISARGREFFCDGPLNKSLRVINNKHLYFMNRRRWNNETICIGLRIIQIFWFKYDSVEMFSA
jgi:hypothetical protein